MKMEPNLNVPLTNSQKEELAKIEDQKKEEAIVKKYEIASSMS